MAIDENKQKALAAALGQIEKQFGKGSIMRLGEDRTMDVETISTGSLSLDIALGAGGLPMGRIVEIYGPESSGKTTLTLQVIAAAQREGKTCAFIDAEHALDPVYARKLGVDIDNLLCSQPDTGEQALEICDALAAAFRPIFTRIAQGAAEREQQRILPDEPIRWLKEAGFGTLRIPREKGGWGASLPQLSALLIELAQADSNLPQALRAHFAFVEDQLNQPDSAGRDRWFRRFLDGELVGSGWTEIGAVKLGEVNTRVTPAEGGWRLDGEKFYSTGALYADWIDVFARRSDTASDVIALVSTQQTGVVREDDWDGFGQRLTGSGTTRFTGARVETEHVYDFAQRFRYQTAFYQHVLLATLAGIGLAVERDAAQGVKHRSRMYSHGNAAVPRDDAQVLQVVGQISSWAWATRAAVLQAAESLQQAYVAHVSDDEALIARRNQLAEVEAAQAQVIASDWIPRAATELFNALGASDTRTRLALDRHWRNARTVASHNPVIYKARNIGNWLVNGEAPTFIWQIGNGEKTAG